MSNLLMYVLKGANTIDEAVGQFYENPNKYSQSQTGDISKPPNDTKEAKLPAYSPSKDTSSYAPSYSAPANTTSITRFRPHTNQVIEAGHIRARDEVGLMLSHFILLIS
jgi:hypothetical protein